jgi:3-hydroxyisobutyrate dehydrogenase-like beta-hydroxyacid dehydrogenase
MTTPEAPESSTAGPSDPGGASDAHSSDTHSHPTGSLSEEALKLAETLQTWLNTGAAMTGAGSASECKVCPLCQLIGVVNTMKPEVLAHLTEAGFSLVAAYKSATEAAERSWSSGNRPPVQHIKVT